ncbi:MAG: hypothetical protein QF893_01505 [Alphaproteobacteria bacterium]|jgi:hypothetical protein|nr:hypothetical protein [Alphaproteobacteria bacterium]
MVSREQGAPAATIGQKLITCFLPKGKGLAIVEGLHREFGIDSANLSSGRGQAMVETVSYGRWVEVDILSVVSAAGEAEDVFSYIFEMGGLDRIHGGLMYQAELTAATAYALPAVPEETA